MTWMSKPEAASALGVSVRTLERKIVAGELKTRRDDQGVVVHVVAGKDRNTVAHLGRRLKEPPSGHVPQRAEATEEVRGMLSVVGEYRRELGLHAHRARINARIAWSVVAAMLTVIALGAWHYGRATAGYEADLRLLQTAHDGELDRLQTDARGAQRTVGELGMTRKRLAAEQAAAAELRDSFARLSGELAAATAERDRVYDERDRLVNEREQLALERDRLMQILDATPR